MCFTIHSDHPIKDHLGSEKSAQIKDINSDLDQEIYNFPANCEYKVCWALLKTWIWNPVDLVGKLCTVQTHDPSYAVHNPLTPLQWTPLKDVTGKVAGAPAENGGSGSSRTGDHRPGRLRPLHCHDKNAKHKHKSRLPLQFSYDTEIKDCLNKIDRQLFPI